jgi:predicted tellurium resistance membrane protein TerC
MSYLFDPTAWIAFLTLTSLELVLGIDNLIFISILVDKLPPNQRERIRRIGLFFAMFMRIGLLLLLSWVVGATDPVLSVFGKPLSPRDLILLGGGLFLLWKSTHEVHQMIEGDEADEIRAVKTTAMAVTLQIIIIDLVFSLDSIVTAVGMVDDIPVMIAAVVASVALMMLFARSIGNFVSQHPTIKMLALSFLVVIGITLIVEGFGTHVAKGYIYFAMAFSLGVEILNLVMKKKHARRHDSGHP